MSDEEFKKIVLEALSYLLSRQKISKGFCTVDKFNTAVGLVEIVDEEAVEINKKIVKIRTGRDQ